MKVLFITNVPSPYRVDFFNELGKKCELTVLFENKIAKSRDAEWKATNAIYFKAVFLRGIKVGEAEVISFGVFQYLSKKRYDVIVVGMYSSPTGILAIEYMKMKKISFLISSDGGLIKNDSSVKYKIKTRYISAACAWLSTGETTTNYLCHYGAKRERVYVYPFSSVMQRDILLDIISKEEKIKLRSELGMTEKRILLSVGQFIHRKGYDILMKACRGLSEDVGIYIVGGEATEEYLMLQKELKLEHVHFVGFKGKEELQKYYKAADLFVLPTREDIWGLVVNEAMAYGLPVITTDKCIAGIEMVKNGVTGDIVPVEDVQAIADKIMAQDLYDREKVLETARRYSINQMVEEHMKVFKQMGWCNVK